MSVQIRYFLLGRTPVRFVGTLEGGLRVEAFDILVGSFVARPEYWSEIEYDRDGDAREVTALEFEAALEALKQDPPSWARG